MHPLSCESICHEYPSNYEFENFKQYVDVDKEEIVMKMWYEKKGNYY